MTKHNSRKPRDVNLYLDMGNPTVINRIGLKKDGCVVFEDIKGAVTPAAAFISNSHYRQNKPPKIINQTSLLPNRLIIDFNKALSNYTCVFAIDTNKPEKSLPNIVFTGLVHAKVQESENNILKVLIYKESVLEFHDLNSSCERFGWAYILKSISGVTEADRIAVIVDSELKSIPAINQRKEAIIDNYFLPDNFELIYASSDKGSEFIANQLLKECDKNTREVAKLIASGNESNLPKLIKSNSEEQFTCFRSWEKNLNPL